MNIKRQYELNKAECHERLSYYYRLPMEGRSLCFHIGLSAILSNTSFAVMHWTSLCKNPIPDSGMLLKQLDLSQRKRAVRFLLEWFLVHKKCYIHKLYGSQAVMYPPNNRAYHYTITYGFLLWHRPQWWGHFRHCCWRTVWMVLYGAGFGHTFVICASALASDLFYMMRWLARYMSNSLNCMKTWIIITTELLWLMSEAPRAGIC